MKEAAALAASRCLGVLRSSPFCHPETFMRECFCSLQVELCPRNDWKAQEALVRLGHHGMCPPAETGVGWGRELVRGLGRQVSLLGDPEFRRSSLAGPGDPG